ncbi:MAG: DNA cytosine methyltransferase [Neptuniibacter sp.]
MNGKQGLYIDLFAGCGGLSLGLSKAGWKGLFAIEKSPDAFATLQHNLINSGHFEWPNWLPQTSHAIEVLLEKYRANLSSLEGKVDLIAGGPPCQGFSPAGRRDPNDPRNKMAEHYIEVVKLVKPKYLLLENVRGFDSPFEKRGGKEPVRYSQIVKERMEHEGYVVSYQVVKSSEWGVPQNRPRFILIAIRKDCYESNPISPFEVFQASRKSFLHSKGLDPYSPVSVKDAISDLEQKGCELIDSFDSPIKGYKQIRYKEPNSLGNYQKIMRETVEALHSPGGLRIPRHSERVKNRFKRILEECPKGITLSKEHRARFGSKKHALTPLDPDKPSATVTTLPDDILHYDEPRILTVREMARLQSFPDHYEFMGPYTTGGAQRKSTCPKYTQVGNAVPPLLAEALGSMIYRIKDNE